MLEELESTEKLYSYEKDRLVTYDGEECEYNVCGSPTKYRGKSASWMFGTLMTGYNGTTFTYEITGIRLSKNEIKYIYDKDGRLIKQSNGIEFIYDNGGIAGIKYNGTEYIYRKNVQGDITHILDKNGNTVAEYAYDAWGNCTIIKDTDGIAEINPYRYRGYYYDVETKLYYLQTRYYDPEVGRFISQDDVSYLDPEHINGLNLYAYCLNNPVMGIDPTGNKVEWWQWLISGVALVGGALLCFVPGAQGLGVSLMVAGGSMLASNIMSAAGVDGKTASIISSALSIVAGIALCFTPFAGIGASMIGSGIGGIVGGFISEAAGGSFELGACVGSIIGGLLGGKAYDAIKFSNIAQRGVLIGKVGAFEAEASARGLAYYKGMPGYGTLSKIAPKLTSRLGWAHNYHYISNVMKHGGMIYNLGGIQTGSYAKELALIAKYGYKFIINLF